MEVYYEKLTDILEEETVKDSDILRDFEEWDSLAALSIVSMASDEFKKILTAEDIAKCVTVGDLKVAIENK